MAKRFAFALMVTVVAMLAGCVDPPHTYNMTLKPKSADEYAASRALTKNVNMGKVSSADLHFPPWAPRMDSARLRVVLKKSLGTAKLLAPKEKGRYALSAKLLKVKQPMAGFSMTVTTEVRYTLKRVSDQAVVFKKTLTTPYTATFSDGVSSNMRLLVATEKSVRRNITQIVNDLYALKINGTKVSSR